MDVSTLHTLMEDLAAFLSEVTPSELRTPTQGTAGDVGDLYLKIMDQNVSAATVIAGQAVPRGLWPDPVGKAFLGASVDSSGGCGLEVGYRQTARLVEDAFASATNSAQRYQPTAFPGTVELTTLYEMQISNTVVHTWVIAQALGLSYQPAPDIARRVLRTAILWPTQPRPGASPTGTSDGPMAVDDVGAIECIFKWITGSENGSEK